VAWRPTPGPIAAIAVTAFLAVGGLIGVRVADGMDPGVAALTRTQSSSSSTSSTAVTDTDERRQSDQTQSQPANPSTGTSGG